MKILHHDPFSNSEKYKKFDASQRKGVSAAEVLLLDAFKQFHQFVNLVIILNTPEMYKRNLKDHSR